MAIMDGLKKVVKSLFVLPGSAMKLLELFLYAMLAYAFIHD